MAKRSYHVPERLRLGSVLISSAGLPSHSLERQSACISNSLILDVHRKKEQQRSTKELIIQAKPGLYSARYKAKPGLYSARYKSHSWFTSYLLLSNYFTKKVKDTGSSFAHPESTSPSPHLWGPYLLQPSLLEDVLTLVTSNRANTCSLDPIPSSLLQNISHEILPLLTTLIKSSLPLGLIPAPFKIATVKQLPKEPSLDSSEIQNYRPVSLLSFLSETLERTA